MIIPLAIVLGFHAQGKTPDLETQLERVEAAYQPFKPGADPLLSPQGTRSNASISAKFEAIAVKAGTHPIAVEAWIMALISAPKNLQRENHLIDKILLTKTVGQKQFARVFPYVVFMTTASSFFETGARVLKVVDLLVAKAPSKDLGSALLIFKANSMDDTNELKWDVYNRLVEQYPGTLAAKEAREIILRKKHLQPGDVFPDFISKDSKGEKFRLTKLRGKVVVLEFWANWCPSCQRTIPIMQGVEKTFDGQNVEFIGINSDGDASVVRELEAKYNITHRNLVDGSPAGPISISYNIMAWPSFFVISKDGKVAYRSSGIDADGMTKAISDALK